MNTPFLTSKFVGKRFDQHTIPISVLQDLNAYEELIRDLARWIYKEEHGQRKRVPKGFAEKFSLHIGGQIGEGSAELSLFRYASNDILFVDDESGSCFVKARDMVTDFISAVSDGKADHPPFPDEMYKYFNSFGKSLHGDEKIELASANGHSRSAVYSPAVRKALILSKLDTYNQEFEWTGHLLEVDVDKHTFRFCKDWKLIIEGAYKDEVEDNLLDALREHRSTLCSIQGTASFGSDEVPKRILEVEDVNVLENFNDALSERIRSFAKLEDGWLDGTQGSPFSENQLKWYAEFFDSIMLKMVPKPSIYPTPLGTIEAEWRFGPIEIITELDAIDQTACIDAINVTSRKTIDHQEILLQTGSDVDKFITALKRIESKLA